MTHSRGCAQRQREELVQRIRRATPPTSPTPPAASSADPREPVGGHPGKARISNTPTELKTVQVSSHSSALQLAGGLGREHRPHRRACRAAWWLLEMDGALDGAVANPMTGRLDGTTASNPVAVSGRRGRTKVERRMAEDSNAVLCPDWFPKAREMLCAKDGGETTLSRAIPYLCAWQVLGSVLAPVLDVTFDESKSASGLTSKDVLIYVSVTAVAFLVLAMGVCVGELGRVLHQDGGELAALGLGATMIRHSALQFLLHARIVLRVLKSISVVFGLGVLQ